MLCVCLQDEKDDTGTDISVISPPSLLNFALWGARGRNGVHLAGKLPSGISGMCRKMGWLVVSI